MRVLAVTNMYPSAAMPANGVFIAEQIKGLRSVGIDVEVHFVDRRSGGMGVYYSMLGSLQEAIRQSSAEVLHIMYGGVMADRITRNLNGLPQVVTFHGSDLLGENLAGIIRKFISRYGVFCSHRAARRADRVVVVSERLKKALPGGIDAKKIRVIPCGIDLNRFHCHNKNECQQLLNWSPDVFHVLFPSHSTNSVKRPALARAAVGALSNSGLRTELHFLEGVPNEQVPIWMNASDALLLTSAHEGSPTVVKEGLACGVPVVSVDVGDVAERIEGIEGCYLASADPSDLAAKLRLVRQRNERVPGREKLQELSLESVSQKLVACYAEIAARSTCAPCQKVQPRSR